ncbi:MAG TPA: hypothetical protein VML19_23495 [Verrucomicrobiae bacterium]|nr:hypothetical protein [Verrucomicrobiae bacterium]
MLRKAYSSLPPAALVVAAAVLLPLAGSSQQDLNREGGGSWSRTFTGQASPQGRLVIESRGPVALEGGGSGPLVYTVKLTVMAQTEAEARRMLDRLALRILTANGATALIAPTGRVLTTVSVKAPHLDSAFIRTTEGGVDVRGIDGGLEAQAVGELHVDRVGGDCTLFTAGGDVTIGDIAGNLHCTTRAGRIGVKSVKGDAVLTTDGGDIDGGHIGGGVTAHTGGGSVHIVTAGGTVNMMTGGGELQVDKAGGPVIARNLLGPVTISGAAGGVQCENASGPVRVSNIAGPINISTAMGSILANLMGSHIGDSTLATANGDVTVMIPSNVGVTIRAQNEMADSMRRIVSEFPTIKLERQATRLIATGPVNGGGPVLRIAALSGTIYIKRQR